MSKLGFLLLFLLCTAFICLTRVSISAAAAADTLFPNQTIRDQDTLVSSDQTFELGFFSLGSSSNNKRWYLGIWFKDIPDSVVWVANRNDPLTDKNATLRIASDGNLILLNNSQHIVWSSNTSVAVPNAVAQLQNTGNFLLRDSNVHMPGSATDILWQSFDHPVDTYLAGMKLGRDLETGVEWYLTSWKSSDDPSIGDYTYRLKGLDLIQIELLYKGSTTIFRTGHFNGLGYSGTAMKPNPVLRTVNVFEARQIYISYELVNSSLYMTKVVLNQTIGKVQRMVANSGSAAWSMMYQMPNDPCDEYGKCEANGICKVNSDRICDCLEGYMPSSLVRWELLNWTGGCVRRIQSNCSGKVGFRKVSWVKLPDLLEFWVNKNMSLGECRTECSTNCNCTAFANSDIREGGSGCIMWFGNLIDIKEYRDADHEQDLYIKLTAAETRTHSGLAETANVAIITAVSAFSAMLIFAMIIIRKGQMNRRGIKRNGDDIDLPIFDMAAISVATNNFSQTNIIGVGGFGPVYKGSFPTGQEIAVKRLSKTSGQGIEEFMNEVRVIARLQHKNLVALLGCCIDGEEKMLIYEYMPNKSLDYFIFDHDRSYQLEWSRRFDIAVGIARGLLYLHQDSKLRIIHRDLKTSNILLDENLQPKISDFGLARIFVGDEKEARTRRVVGTYGYMSPEYAFNGKFSTTSDVYSYGVLLMEIVSGKKNRGFCHPNHHHNLLGHAWLLWNEGRSLELMDKCLDYSSVESQVERCIQVSLLCVQRDPQDRPEMSSVAFMLVNEEAVIAQPKEPGFFTERLPPPLTTTQNSNNELTVTMIDGR